MATLREIFDTMPSTEASEACGVWRAATDPSGRLRFPAGADVVAPTGAGRMPQRVCTRLQTRAEVVVA